MLTALLTVSAVSRSQEAEVSYDAFRLYRDGLIFYHEGKYQEALQLLQRAQGVNPDPLILKSIGDVCIHPNVRKYDIAASAYEKYLEEYPNDDRTINITWQIYGSFQKFGRAATMLTKVINSGNNRPQYYEWLIDAYLKDGMINDAETTSLLYIERSGESEESCQKVANLFIQNNKLENGLSFFSEYVEKNRDVENIGLIVGILHRYRGQSGKAEEAFRAVLGRNEYASLTRGMLASLYVEQGRVDDALGLYEGIDFEDPREVDVKVGIVNNYLGQREIPFEKIERIMKSVTGHLAADERVFFFLGIAQYGQGRIEDAAESMKESADRAPLFYNAHIQLAQYLYELERYKEALKYADHAMRINPNDKNTYVLKGLLQDELGDRDGAAQTYEAGIAIKDNDAKAAHSTLLNNYSYLLANSGRDLERALEMAKKAVLADPRNDSFLDTIGWVYFKLGKYEDALEYIKKSIAESQNNDGPSAEVLDHIGDVYEKLGEMSKAGEYWQKALEMDADNDQIREKLNRIKNKKRSRL